MLLASLLLQPNVVVSTELLIEVLWPTTAPRSAAADIRAYVHSLRRRLAESSAELADHIQSRSSGYILTARRKNWTATRSSATPPRHSRRSAGVSRKRRLRRSISRISCGVEVLEGPQHDHAWGSAVARLDELRLSVQEQRLKVRIELGRCAEPIVELRGLLEAHPLREELWQQLIMALLASGRKAEALQAYVEVERILREELDAAPGPRLRELRAHVARHNSRQARWPADVRFPICQLPLDLPDFTGREDMVAALVELLYHRRSSRKPTVAVLSGAPGVGKSTIAVRPGHAVPADFPDGQLRLDVAGISSSPRTPMAVLAELLRSLGVPDAGMPREERLTAAFTPYFDLRGHQDDLHHTHAIALASARRAGDVCGQALVLRNVGEVHLYQDMSAESLVSFEERFRLLRPRCGDRTGRFGHHASGAGAQRARA
jgi:DNA-binding SARP family transcriptional activator